MDRAPVVMMGLEAALKRLVHALLQLRPACCAPCQHAMLNIAWAAPPALCNRAACWEVGQLLASSTGTLQVHGQAGADRKTHSHGYQPHAVHGLCMQHGRRSAPLFPTMRQQQLPCSVPAASVRYMATSRRGSGSHSRDAAGGSADAPLPQPVSRERTQGASNTRAPSPPKPSNSQGYELYRQVEATRLELGTARTLEAAVAAANAAVSESHAAQAGTLLWPWVRKGEEAVQGAAQMAKSMSKEPLDVQRRAFSLYVAACLPRVDSSQLMAMLQPARGRKLKLDPLLLNGPVRARVVQFLFAKGAEASQDLEAAGDRAAAVPGAAATSEASIKAPAGSNTAQLQRVKLSGLRARFTSTCAFLDAVGEEGDGMAALVQLADKICRLDAQAAMTCMTHGATASAGTDAAGAATGMTSSIQLPHLSFSLVLLDELWKCGRPHLRLAATVLSRVTGASGQGVACCLEAAGFLVPERVVGQLEAAGAAGGFGGAGAVATWQVYAVSAEFGAARALELACAHLELDAARTANAARTADAESTADAAGKAHVLNERSSADGTKPCPLSGQLLLKSVEQLLRMHHHARRMQPAAAAQARKANNCAAGSSISTGGRWSSTRHDPYAAAAPTHPMDTSIIREHVSRAVPQAERLAGFVHLSSYPLLYQFLAAPAASSYAANGADREAHADTQHSQVHNPSEGRPMEEATQHLVVSEAADVAAPEAHVQHAQPEAALASDTSSTSTALPPPQVPVAVPQPPSQPRLFSQPQQLQPSTPSTGPRRVPQRMLPPARIGAARAPSLVLRKTPTQPLLWKVRDWGAALSAPLPDNMNISAQKKLQEATKTFLGIISAAGPDALSTLLYPPEHPLHAKHMGAVTAPSTPAVTAPPGVTKAGAQGRQGLERAWDEVAGVLRAASHPDTGCERLLVLLRELIAEQPAWLQLHLAQVIADASSPTSSSHTDPSKDSPSQAAPLHGHGASTRHSRLPAAWRMAAARPVPEVHIPEVSGYFPPSSGDALRCALKHLADAVLFDEKELLSISQLAQLACLSASVKHRQQTELFSELQERMARQLGCSTSPSVGESVCMFLHALDSVRCEVSSEVVKQGLVHLQRLAKQDQVKTEAWAQLLPVVLRTLGRLSAQAAAADLPSLLQGKGTDSPRVAKGSAAGRQSCMKLVGEITQGLARKAGPVALLTLMAPALKQEPAALMCMPWGPGLVKWCLHNMSAREVPATTHIRALQLLLDSGKQATHAAEAAAAVQAAKRHLATTYPSARAARESEVARWFQKQHEASVSGEWAVKKSESPPAAGYEALLQALEQLCPILLRRLPLMTTGQLIEVARLVTGAPFAAHRNEEEEEEDSSGSDGSSGGSSGSSGEHGQELLVFVQARLAEKLVGAMQARVQQLDAPQLASLLVALARLPRTTSNSPRKVPQPGISANATFAGQMMQWGQLHFDVQPPEKVLPQPLHLQEQSPVKQLEAAVRSQLQQLLQHADVTTVCQVAEALGAGGLMHGQAHQQQEQERIGMRVKGEAGSGRRGSRVAMTGAAMNTQMLGALYMAAERVLGSGQQVAAHTADKGQATGMTATAGNAAAPPAIASQTQHQLQPASSSPADAAQLLSSFSRIGVYRPHIYQLACHTVAEGLAAELAPWGAVFEDSRSSVKQEGQSTAGDTSHASNQLDNSGPTDPCTTASSNQGPAVKNMATVSDSCEAGSSGQHAHEVLAGGVVVPGTCLGGMEGCLELLQSLARVGHAEPVVVDLAARATTAALVVQQQLGAGNDNDED